MKKYVLILGIIFFFSCSKEDVVINPEQVIIVGDLDFATTMGGSKNDVYKSIANTADGGYVILGYTQSKDGNIYTKLTEDFDFWVLKFSADNALLWSKTFGGSEDDRGEDIIATKDGGFALLGYSQSTDNNVTSNAGSKDFWILKLTGSGALSWQKNFGFSGSDYGTTLLETNDNGYLITGVLDVTASDGQGNSRSTQRHAGGDIWAIKLNNFGALARIPKQVNFFKHNL